MRISLCHSVWMAVVLFLAMSFGIAVAAVPSSEQQYAALYLKINEGEHADKAKDYAAAMKSFEECYTGLAKIREANPRWESALVASRLRDCEAKIIDLRMKVPAADLFTFPVSGNRETTRNRYDWKTRIPMELFWIGETASNSWNKNWIKANGGPDSPESRNGYAAGGHASAVNPFYVALPFDDLAYPTKAQRWLPPGWNFREGSEVSVCKDRWVMIKNSKGDICYAQWEDVGPGRGDNAEYVFGNEPPDEAGKGISISPAVAEYLGVEGKSGTVSWRFVDDIDVRPGPWLKLEEQAVLFRAMHQEDK